MIMMRNETYNYFDLFESMVILPSFLGVQDTVSNTNANVKTIFSECGCDIQLVRNGTSSRKSADCDWLRTKQLSTNRRGDKRQRESESMIMFPDTKKMRTGLPMI